VTRTHPCPPSARLGFARRGSCVSLPCLELGLAHYIGSIRQIPRLTPEEEAAVGALCAAGDVSAQKRMVEANLRLVVHVAYRFQNCGLAMEDLIAEGALGLMRAAERFKPDLGRIGTYAIWWIRQSIQRAIRHAQHIRLPENVAVEVHRLARAQRQLRLDLGREPTELELQVETEASPRAMRVFVDGITHTVSLDAPITADGDSDLTLADQLASEQPEPVSEALSLVEVLPLHLKDLDAMSAQVLTLYFGLNGEPPRSLEAIARKLGVSSAWIGQVRDKTLARLRQKLTKYLERKPEDTESDRLQQELQALRNQALAAAA
jgi:RNA polymerase sigma factor (sigma-70 family)